MQIAVNVTGDFTMARLLIVFSSNLIALFSSWFQLLLRLFLACQNIISFFGGDFNILLIITRRLLSFYFFGNTFSYSFLEQNFIQLQLIIFTLSLLIFLTIIIILLNVFCAYNFNLIWMFFLIQYTFILNCILTFTVAMRDYNNSFLDDLSHCSTNIQSS